MPTKIIFLLIPFLLFGEELYNSTTWKSLLEYSNKFNIQDKKFYFSKKHTLKNEFFSTIKAFKTNPKAQCKFPARKLFLEHNLHIKFPKVNCPGLKEYETKAPPKKLYLVFASENVKNPTSMMGHSFFKIDSGKHKYAITFFTVINTANPAKLLFENIYGGMRGIFALQPYKDILYNYLSKENRNVWEFELNLDEYHKKLIYYHFWELKDIKLRYYFVNFNCADVVFYNLALANSKIYKNKPLFLTPLDTVFLAKKYGLIKKRQLMPSDEYFIKMLETKVSENRINLIKNIVNNNLKIPKLNFYELYLLKTYGYIKYKNKKLSVKKYQKIANYVYNHTNKNLNLDISKYKSPTKLPKERKIITSFKQINYENYMKLAFLPSSHFLSDNNNEYVGESELKLFYLSLLVNKHHLKIDEFDFYSIYSLIDYDSLLKPYSYRFETMIKNNYFGKNKENLVADAGIGITKKYSDIYFYGLLNGGFTQKNIFIYPELGFTIKEILNMKSVFKYKYLITNNNKKYRKYDFSQNLFINKNLKLFINFNKINQNKEYEIGIQKSF